MQRLTGVFLFCSFLICHLTWANHSAFLFQLEYALLFLEKKSAGNFLYPVVLLPLIGQLLLLLSIFQRKPSHRLQMVAAALLGLLVLLILFTGMLSRQFMTALSTLPFIAAVILLFSRRRALRKV
jgi:hypothetical protein